jgi:hypothetical protein
MEIDKIKDDSKMLKRQTNLDRHTVREQFLLFAIFPTPLAPSFSLQTTFRVVPILYAALHSPFVKESYYFYDLN